MEATALNHIGASLQESTETLAQYTRNKIDGIKSVLIILSMSAESQAEYLKKEGLAPLTDEFALLFDDIYSVARNDDKLDPNLRDLLDRIDIIFDRASKLSSDEFWHLSSLYIDQRWSEIRNTANSALKLI